MQVETAKRLFTVDEYYRMAEVGILGPEDRLTVKQVSARLGIDRGTINKRRIQGQIKARVCNDHGQWVYWLPEPGCPKGHFFAAQSAKKPRFL